MRTPRHAIWATLLLLRPAEASAPPPALTDALVRETAERGLARMDAAGRNWRRNRACFSCHHQTLPMLALAEGGGDAAWMKAQADLTHEHFRKLIPTMNDGKHIGGGAYTAAYGLWALRLAGVGRDETTEAMVTYLLKVQGKSGTWDSNCVRPPSQTSLVTLTVLSVVGMEKHATEGQRAEVAKASEAARRWLAKAKAATTEDLAFRLWGLHLLGGAKEAKPQARAALIAAQRPDGGWAQEAGRASDAYSTGQALYVLRVTGDADEAARRAAAYLVRTQHADGSWRVQTRAIPVQRDFDNGDPHGKSQFLSAAATGWATAGLARMRR